MLDADKMIVLNAESEMRFKVKDQFRFYRNDNWIASIGVASGGYGYYAPKCDHTKFELGQWVYPS